MDVMCPRCGEPWDITYLQEDCPTGTLDRVLDGEGCPACEGDESPELSPRAQEAAEIQSALRSVLGDDVDGIAAEMEDLGLL